MRREWLLLLVAIVVSLAAGEILVRLLLPRPGFVPFLAPDTDVLVRDSVRGYAYAPRLKKHIVTKEYEIDFVTNELGMRDSPIDSGPAPRRRVLAVGDSYSQGLGVQSREAWPKRFEALVPETRVFNAGVSGYSLQQMRLTVEHFAPILKPHAIVVGLYGFGYRRIADPYVVIPGGASPVSRSMVDRVKAEPGGYLVAAFESPRPRAIAFWIDEHWYLGGHALHAVGRLWHALHHTDAPPSGASLEQAMAPMLAELLRLEQYADSARIPLAALDVNSQDADGTYAPDQRDYNRIIAAFANEHRICVVDPIPAFEAAARGRPLFRFVGDRHWNRAADSLAAAVLADALRAARPPSPCRAAGAALY